jgi:aminoglycoside phosphotransferase (APT) family kinase protein
VELQLKQIIPVLQELPGSTSQPLKNTHDISKLWEKTRNLLQQTGLEDSFLSHLDAAGQVLLQLHKIDPNEEVFRYPVGTSGTSNRSFNNLHMRVFHETLEKVAGLLDAVHAMVEDIAGNME